MKRLIALGLLSLLVGCATLVGNRLLDTFGPPDPGRFDHPADGHTSGISYRRDVQPILAQRCVVCHACYDAACQLKLGSYEGITRGASKAEVYDGARLLEAAPTRLFIDADTPSAWRRKGFFPVLNEYPSSQAAELQASLIARALDLKDAHPLTPGQPAPESLDFSLDRSNQCPNIAEYDEFARKNPQMGMPFGLPALSPRESSIIRSWLEEGAPYDGAIRPTPAALRQIAVWERFFNGDSLRDQLVSRYIYEHLFLGNLYFEGEAPLRYYRLLRSATPPGQPVREIATRRPFDDPHVPRVWYRLIPVEEAIAAKTHMPYALSPARMARWKALFQDTPYEVSELPGYSASIAANPFKTFAALPVKSRYRFMLDEAQFTVMGFIKGPVCRGQTALNVINDHFWVFFQDPETLTEHDADFLERESRNLDLPAGEQSNSLVLTPLLRYSHQEEKFLEAKSAYFESRFQRPEDVNLNLIWNGEGHNPNAALSIYRHFDSATVLKGLVGEKPKTAWIFSYSLLERVHYLLTAGYDVFGNIGHQVNTRLYMDFLRMEGEFNFIAMLPMADRVAVRDYWYRNASSRVKDHVYGRYAHFNRETGLSFKGGQRPEHELMTMLAGHVGKALPTQHLLSSEPDTALRKALEALASVSGKSLVWMPEASLLRIEDSGQTPRNLSLLRNTAHRNITMLLREDKTLLPDEFTLDVVPGFVSVYPNAFYRLSRAELPEFTRRVAELTSEADYRALIERFGVRRTSNDFWALSDRFNADYLRSEPIEAGILDLNRYENR
ncbi:fatty acid cis/trans isomerase [Uliginosibacterium paludis]|uniref:Fatty acid cis/trans isomerase n=1 Tax=Uliginosibacterium paludis TaxID=1615952 RepID=A0ABV2CT83_9RHOO